MRRILSFLFFSAVSFSAMAQDNCSNATALCANNTIVSTTQGATFSASDPNISCGDNTVNNSVWFSVLAINNGTATITVSRIDSLTGLEMEVYTGSCGSLSSTGSCAHGSGPNGSMSVTFATIAGTTYYIMVDGTNGNQESFNILATTTNDALIAKPDANFIADPSSGCIPLSVLLQNITQLHGGTNITYNWRVDGGSFLPATGLTDTTVLFNTLGTHDVDFRVCNNQCGCKTINQEIVVQNLFPTIGFSSLTNCINAPIDFAGDANVLPDPPTVDPNITNWDWNFGDPNSGANNSASGQFATHSFVGPGTSFTVTLIVQGTCGPDTARTIINLNPQPVVSAGPDQTICEGNTATLTANVISGALPIQSYNWIGPGTIGCANCPSTTVDDLPAGGPYAFTLDIVDANGCTADTSVNITVSPKPTVDPGSDQFTCANQPVTLGATPTSGIPPFHYLWSPSAGLNNDTIANPTATVSVSTLFCVTITDSLGCVSDAACMNVNIYDPPSIVPSIPVLCSTNPNLTDTFTVVGAGAGSTYSWILSSNYSLIHGATTDSSSIYVTFPPGTGSYTFTAIVFDPGTGCTDTVSTTFTVTNGLNMSISGPTKICSGDIATLTANGAITFAWTANPPYPFADSTQATQDVSPAVTTIFTVYGVAGSCSQVITDTLRVSPNPVAVAAPIADFCGCKTVALNGTGSTPGMNYLWTSFSGATITNPTALVTTSTICSGDIFTLTVTDPASGCFQSATTSANESALPDATADVTPGLICPGVSTLVSLTGTSAAGVTFHWSSIPSVPITDTTALSTTATVTGTTAFFLTVTDAQGCDSIVSDTVFVYPPPVFTATPAFLCTSDALQSTLDISGAGSGSSYSWDTIPACAVPNSASGSTQLFDFSSCGVGNYHFSVTVTDGITGCINVVTQNVTIVAGVTLVVSNDTSICEGSSVTLTANGANSFLWSTSQTTSSITLSGLTAAGSPYQFIVTGTIGSCTGSDTINVIVNSVPVTSPITGNIAVCANDTGDIYSVTPIIGNYTWNVSGGAISSGQGTNTIHVNWGAAGSGVVSVFDTSSGGCHGATQTLNVTINPVPVTPAINGSDTVCVGSTTSYFVFPNAGSSYSWTTTGGTIIGSSTGTFISVNWGVAGSGTVTVIETNAVGCSGGTQTKNIVIESTPLSITIQGNAIQCENGSQLYFVTGNAGSTYNWTVVSGSITSGQGTDSINVQWGSAGAGSVSVVETNSFGCPGPTATLNVTINTQPVASVSPDSATVCGFGPYSISGSANVGTIHWITSGNGTFSDTTIASPVYNPGTDTGYVTLTMILSNAPCPSASAQIVLYFAPSPIVTVTATRDTICAGDVDSLTATGGGTYLWNNPAADTTSTIVVTPASTKVYTVAVTNSFGCTTNDSMTIVVNQLIVAIVSPDSATVCNNASVPITGNVNVGTIHWTTTGTGNFSDTTIASPVYNPGSDTGYVILTMVVSNSPCPNDTEKVVLHFSVSPIIFLTASDTTICQGTIDTLAATGGGSYTWSLPASDTSTIYVTPFATTTYHVTVSNGFGCISSDSITIVVDSIPVISPITGRDSVCAGDTGVIYTISPAVGNYIWTVSGGSINSGQGTDSIFVNWGSAGAGIVSAVDTNAAGCFSIQQDFNVVINPVPVTAPINGQDTVCANSIASYSVPLNAGSGYNWTVSGGSIIGSSTGNFISVNWGATGIGSLSVTETNSSNCPGVAQTLSVIINPVPIPVFVNGANLLCAGDTTQIYSTVSTTGSTYSWSVFGGTLVSGQGSDSIIVNWGAATTDSIIVLETNTYGCTSDTSTFYVTLNPLPTATALPDSGSVCQSDTFQVFGTATNGSIQWITSGNGTFSNDTIASPSYASGSVDTGYVQLTMIVTSPQCGTDTAVVVLHISAPPVVSTTATQSSICFRDSDTLSVTGIGTYLWSNAGETTSTIVVSPPATTTYYVTVTNNFSCSTTDSIKVIVIPPGIPNGGPDQLICIDDTAHLTATVQNAGGVLWSTLGDGIFLPDTVSLSVIYIPGTNDSTLGGTNLVIVSTGACLNLTDTIHIAINQFPTVNAGNDTLLSGGSSAGASVPLHGVVTNVTGGLWTTSGTGIFSPDDTSMNAIYTPSSQDYSLDSIILTLTTVGGCRTIFDYLVINFSPFDIPNVFTPYPTSPGFNDFFVIKNLPEGTKLKIWDRWGLLVYSTDNYQNNWDAAEVKADTYYYALMTPTKEYHGFVRVIKEE